MHKHDFAIVWRCCQCQFPIPPMWFIFPVSFLFCCCSSHIFFCSHSADFSSCTKQLIFSVALLVFVVFCVIFDSFFLYSFSRPEQKKQLCSFMSTIARSHRWLTLEAHTHHIFNAFKRERKQKKKQDKKKTEYFCISGGFLHFCFVVVLFFSKPACIANLFQLLLRSTFMCQSISVVVVYICTCLAGRIIVTNNENGNVLSRRQSLSVHIYVLYTMSRCKQKTHGFRIYLFTLVRISIYCYFMFIFLSFSLSNSMILSNYFWQCSHGRAFYRQKKYLLRLSISNFIFLADENILIYGFFCARCSHRACNGSYFSWK